MGEGTVTFTTSELEGIFGVSQRIKHGEKRHRAAHVFLGIFALCSFMALAMFILYGLLRKDKFANNWREKTQRMPVILKKFMLAILCGMLLSLYFV